MSLTVNNCPFCTHDDVEIDKVGCAEFAVTCPECRTIGPICGDIMSAIGAWNKAGTLEEAAEDGDPEKRCTYPRCNCPFDAPADPNWCARGLKKGSA